MTSTPVRNPEAQSQARSASSSRELQDRHAFIPELDGLRAIAVLLVMFFHLQIPGFSLGWAGVPLFFVLSGFLITGILLRAREQPFGAYLRTFLVRRSLRIFPLFYLYLAINAAILIAMGRPASGYGWYVTYLQNYAMGLDMNSIPGLLGHTWSLAVEEQFYLLWPAIVFFARGRSLARICVALIVASAAVRWAIYSATGNVHLSIITLFSCMDMLAYGGLLAIWKRSDESDRRPVWLGIASVVVTTAVLWSTGLGVYWKPQDWVPGNPFLFTLLGLTFGLLVWLAANGRTGLLKPVLNSRPALAIGRISYGLYIWHLLCFTLVDRVAVRFGLPNSVRILTALAVSFVVAGLSYRFYERFFLRLKDRFSTENRAASASTSG